MPRPRLLDNGSTVTLDLHGARVAEAERLALAVVQVAAARGRTSVRLVHGSSTSETSHRNRTIKHALHDLLDQDRVPQVVSDLRYENELLLGLAPGTHRDPTPLRLYDLH